MILDQLLGGWRCGSGGGWKVLEKGFKMVCGWPKGVKMALQGAFGTKSDRNSPFGSIWCLVFGTSTPRRAGIFAYFFENVFGTMVI